MGSSRAGHRQNKDPDPLSKELSETEINKFVGEPTFDVGNGFAQI